MATSIAIQRLQEARAKNTTTPANTVNQALESTNRDFYNTANQSPTTIANKSIEDANRAFYNNANKSPADVVKDALNTTGTGTSNGNNNTSTGDALKSYTDGYNKAKDEFKSSQTGNNIDSYKTSENQRLESEKQSIIARVKQAVQQGVDAQNKVINEAPAQYQGSMNQASYQGARNSQAIDERMAALGLGRAGSNITSQTANNNQTSGNINALETAKQKVIDDAKTAIANLQASGSMEEVRLVQEAAAKSIERIQNQQNIIDNRMNDTNNTLFNADVGNLKTVADMGNNEKQLAMQERTLGASLTGIDPLTNKKTAEQSNLDRTYDLSKTGQESDIAFRNSQFDWTKQNDLWSQKMQTDEFDYSKERNAISDTRYDTEWKQKLDEFEWTKNPDNPAVKSMIINNTIKDIELQRMQDPNSAENQIRDTQVKSAKQELAQLMAISPEMKVKEFNAGLDSIYANINQGQQGLDIQKSKSNSGSGSGSSEIPSDQKIIQSGGIPVSEKLSQSIDYLTNEFENNIIGKNKKITNRVGSLERKTFFDNSTKYMIDQGLSSEQREYIMRSLGFTNENEFKKK